MIGRSGERGSGISVLATRHDDNDDDDDIYTYTTPPNKHDVTQNQIFNGL